MVIYFGSVEWLKPGQYTISENTISIIAISYPAFGYNNKGVSIKRIAFLEFYKADR